MERICILIVLVVTLLTISVKFGSASNILGLFIHHGYSHFKVYYPMLRGLAERGHNVTVITYIKNPEPHPNYEVLLLTGMELINVCTLDEFTPTRSLLVMLDEHIGLHQEGQKSCEDFYKSGYVEEVMERHSRTPYDLVITEFFNTDCHLGVPYLLQVPVVAVSSCALMPWYYDRILLPDMPSHVQSEFIGFPEQLNWQERLVNYIQARTNTLLYRYHTNYYDRKIIQKYLHIDVDINEIAKTSTSLIFVNQHYSLSGNQPKTSQLIEIGGIHVDERDIDKPMPREISDFLEGSQEDVLFISWGSMLRASSIAKPKVQTILRVLRKLPMKVIWKWETDETPIENEKFLFVKWAPQLALLCHPKVKFFWSHGGLLGTTEAMHCGKPLMVTPIYGDQFLNGNAVKNRKVGLIIPYNDIDEERLMVTLQELSRPRYTENAIALSKIFVNRETSPQQTAIWWIEHILKHGKIATDVLQTKAVHLNWFIYYSLDSLALLLAGSSVILLLMKRLLQIALLARKKHGKSKQN